MTPILLRTFALATCVLATAAGSRSPNPEIRYEVVLEPRNQAIDVTMRIGHAPRSVRLAMAVHPEYNDRFWRYVRDLRIVQSDKSVRLTQLTDNSWRLDTRSGSAALTYRIQLPREDTTNRPAWHTAIRANAGSINTMDTFLYLADFPRAQIDVWISIPTQIASAVGFSLASAAGAHLVDAKDSSPPTRPFSMARTDAATLLDSPILYGDNLRRWRFQIDNVPHEIVYWPLANSTPFDTTAFVDAIQKVAREAVSVFRKPSYTFYQFHLEDGAYGALEHKNSVTIGMPSRDLARDPRRYLSELAHEFFHTWNLLRLYPEGRAKRVSVDPTEHSKGLWLSEGFTMYYSEALPRRAGFPEDNLPRKDLLARQLEIYYERPGNTRISPEVASARAVDTTGISGDYDANYYTQGRLIATALDLILRDSTRGARGLDDFMRAMYDRFAMKRGFTTDDVQRTANDVCGCRLDQFFENHVRRARPVDFTPYLKTIGRTIRIDTIPGVDAGTALPDTRIWAYPRRSDGRMRVWIQDPASVWGRAGLHTGQDLVAFNGTPVDSFPDFRRAIRTVRIGSDVPVDILEGGGQVRRIVVHVTGYDRPRVTIVENPAATPAQAERRRQWDAAR